MIVYVEKLYHLQCDHCKGFWNLSDVDLDLKQDWCCPWCGHVSGISKVMESKQRSAAPLEEQDGN